MLNPTEYNEQNSSQKPAIEVFKAMGYQYIVPNEVRLLRNNRYDVLLRDILEAKLKELNSFEYKGVSYPFSENNMNQAIRDLDEPLTGGLVKTNEKIYETILFGRSYTELLPDGSKKSFSMQYIDWNCLENNAFHVVEEFSVETQDGKGSVRPDIVLFVNGIPLGVIECKRPSVPIEDAIRQMRRNQGKDHAPHLFKFAQILMATNTNDTSYATCDTGEKYWAKWKEQDIDWHQASLDRFVVGRIPTNQDQNVVSLFHPKRLLELTRFFTLYDRNVKKIARYQQVFAVKEIIKAIEERDNKGNRQSGLIWHTQGSGKSLTMVMLAKYILSQFSGCNPKIVVVTDRLELDKQITQTFNNTGFNVHRANSGRHLVDLIDDGATDIITTLVHKFDKVAELEKSVSSQDIFVLVDESHRTQYGELHTKMKKVFPNACYLGFTGTPLMKKEKNTMHKFGKLLHKYTIADGVEDKTILPLLYEGRMIEQTVNKKAMDNRLEMIVRNLNQKQKEQVMKQWSRFERIASSDQRIQMIAFNIWCHFTDNYKSEGASTFKGIVATNSKTEAVRYLEALEEQGELNCAVVISPPDQREGYDEVDGEVTDKVQRFWKKMMDKYGSEEAYEEEIKDKFIHGDIDIIIVVDKLLTGFDAPRARVLYIDKQMKEHTLLQAIARVNRLYEGKDYGFIVDYRGLIQKLDEAMEIYSGAGLDEFDEGDIQGAVYDVLSIIGSLRQYHSDLLDIFSPVKNKKDREEYEVLLEDDQLRDHFKQVLSRFSRYLAITLESEQVYNALGEKEVNRYKNDFKYYQEVRKSVMLRYSDTIDHKEYQPRMQKLIDTYISAEEVLHITNPVDILDKKAFEEELARLDTERSKADAIRTRMTKCIKEKMEENPAYYKSFSERIHEVLEKYKDKRISETEYLQKMREITEDFRKGKSGLTYPEVIKDCQNAQAFYGVLVEDDFGTVNESQSSYIVGELAKDIETVVKKNVKVDWQDNREVHNKIDQDVEDLLYDFKNDYKIDIDSDRIAKVTEKCKSVALRRYKV